MSLNCFVLGTGTIFSIPLSEKIPINKVEVPIKSLTIDFLKEYIYERKNNILKDLTNDASKLELWHVNVEEVVDVFNEDDIVQKLGGNKMKPTFLFSDYFSDQPPARKIHIIIQPPVTIDQELADITRIIAELGYLPRQNGLGGTLLPYDSSDSGSDSTNEGVKLNDRDISLRFDIMNILIKELINKKVLLVRAPPFAGKTSLAQILEHTLINAPEYSHCRVIRISLLWEGGINWNNFGELWTEIVGITWKQWIRQCKKIPSILIVDEAQLIYGDKGITGDDEKTAGQFWMTVKSLLQDLTSTYIIMFAAYGYKSSNSGLATPVKIRDENCKSLVDINFSPDALKIYVEKFCNIHFKKLDQQSVLNLYQYIQMATGGHAGLIRHILTNTKSEMKKRLDNKNYRLTWEDILKYLNSRKFDKSIYSGCRAVPDVKSINSKQLALCEETYLKGKTSFSDDEDAVHLVKTGVLMVVEDNMYLTFAAPLLKRSFFQQMYGTEDIAVVTPTDLYDFIVRIFTAMCNELSKKILRETLGHGSDGRILEQTWQKEFYRIGTRVLGKDHFLSCDAGSAFGCDGKLDFYVDKLDWAIELLRDGEDMAEHKERFDPIGGEYKEIVKYAKSIAIIDIRSIGILDDRSEAKKVREIKKDFIHVSCSKDFDAFKIESLGKETVTIRFPN
ncbi:7253_t:CDS:2 [Funneliformis geosporum]|nr:7253_t:CDS:2 [Funneliformis geosporum]